VVSGEHKIVIKLQKHRITCTCDDCVAMFPPDRFEASWSMTPQDGSRRVTGRVPLGASNASWTFVAYVDEQRRLVDDWPGFPGTRGARVELSHHNAGDEVVGTRDPALAALAEPIPLRRLAVERINARCMVELGLAPSDIADYVACEQHGQGIPALACAHVIESASPIDATIVYGVDGDYPDLFCGECLANYVGGDVNVARTVCSYCQQAHLYRHRLVTRTWYGAPVMDPN
jgi:hypothetical protein